MKQELYYLLQLEIMDD